MRLHTGIRTAIWLRSVGPNYFHAAIYLSPLIDPDDNYNPYYGNGAPINTPSATIALNTNNNKRLSSNHTVAFDIDLAENLKLSTQESYYNYQRHTFSLLPGHAAQEERREGGEAYRRANTMKTAFQARPRSHISSIRRTGIISICWAVLQPMFSNPIPSPCKGPVIWMTMSHGTT